MSQLVQNKFGLELYHIPVGLSLPMRCMAYTFRYSQIDYGLRCMFPKWNDWDLKYTRKGLAKKRAWRTVRYISLIGLLFVLCAPRKQTDILRNWLSKWGSSILRILKLSLEYTRNVLE